MHDTNSSENFIVLGTLEDSRPVELSPVQEALVPYVAPISVFFWVVWWGIVAVLVVRVLLQKQ